MAARENQGYLIAVIILVLLTLILALAAFLGLSKASENGDELATLNNKYLVASKLAEARGHAIEALKGMAGDFGPTVAEIQTNVDSIERLATDSAIESSSRQPIADVRDDLKVVVEAYKKDMAGNASSGEEGQASNATWRGTINDANQVIAAKNSELSIQRKETQQAKKEAERKINEMATSLATANQARDDADTKYDDERKEKIADRSKFTEELKVSNKSLEDFTEKYDEFEDKSNVKIRGLDKLVKDEQQKNNDLKSRINVYEREVFDRPDGTVVKVNARLQTVYIDLGSADGLTNNRTFAIYDQSVTNFEKSNNKAMIEVTKVFPFRAEARITDEVPTDPILAGDHILTATWDPGFAVSIALAGQFDLDGDIYDDTEKLVSMIERNGGKVVARHDAEGNREGKIDPSIRYLVEGDAPQSGRRGDKNPESARAIVTAMQDMRKEAV